MEDRYNIGAMLYRASFCGRGIRGLLVYVSGSTLHGRPSLRACGQARVRSLKPRPHVANLPLARAVWLIVREGGKILLNEASANVEQRTWRHNWGANSCWSAVALRGEVNGEARDGLRGLTQPYLWRLLTLRMDIRNKPWTLSLWCNIL